MKRIRSRVAVINGIFLVLVGLAWFYLAPAQIGGFTTYVVTHGVSMEPRFHTGDLGLVRPADQYKVGDIVAYHSSLLHTVVLHRIVAIHNGRYAFKGDNNHFLDPEHPTRSQLVGKLWLHLPRAGVLLKWLHEPVVDGVMFGLLGLFLLYGFGEKEQRRKRRRRQEASGSPSHGRPLVSPPRDHHPFNFGALLTASAVTAVVFVALAVFAFTRPAHRAVRRGIPYTQQVSFGYRANVTPGPVYPGSVIKTGDPIFLTLVHQLAIHIGYRITGATPDTVKGTEEVMLKLTGPGGWARSYVLTPRTHFTGNHTSTAVSLDLPQLQSLLTKIQSLTGAGAGGFMLAVGPQVRVSGNVAGHPIKTSFAPVLTFEPEGGQLVVTGGSGSSGAASGSATTSSASSQVDYTPSQTGSVSSPATASATVTVLGVSPTVSLLRWLALLGLLVSVPLALYSFLRKRGEPFEESVRIQAQYGHLIVPIVAGEDLGWPPVDVPNIKALARLAESGQRLILHNRSGDVDTYMVNDEGTVYRYQVKASKIVWGEWTDTPVPAEVPVNAAQGGADAAQTAIGAAPGGAGSAADAANAA